MKTPYKILALTQILIVLSLISAPLAMAINCDNFNNQYKSVEKGASESSTANPDTAQGTNDKNPKTDPDLTGKIVVMTEEPLGAENKKFTYNCIRRVVCSTDTATDKDKTTTAPPLLRTCATTFVEVGKCNDGDYGEDLTKKISSNPPLKYTTCEPVMFYVADGGTDLLYQYISKIYGYMAGLGGIVAVLTMIVAGILRATAGDNTAQVTKANELIKKCISGLVLLFLSAIILYTINPNFFVNSKEPPSSSSSK